MCDSVFLGASSLDGNIGGRYERSMEKAAVGSNFVDEESLRTSRSSFL